MFCESKLSQPTEILNLSLHKMKFIHNDNLSTETFIEYVRNIEKDSPEYPIDSRMKDYTDFVLDYQLPQPLLI